MKGLQLSGTWKPREGYTPTEREKTDQRALCTNNIWYQPKLSIEEIDMPVPGDDEILMKVGACGICGSDIAFLHKDDEDYSAYVGHTRLPVMIGHEFAGEVAAVGKSVKRFARGDLITGETMNWCGQCMSCRTGMFNQCEQLEEIGFSKNGGMAEYLVIKEKYCFSINSFETIYGDRKAAMEAGALTEPMAVAYNGMFVRGGGFMPGAYLAVFGCGPIGLSAIQLAKAAGAAKIIVFDFSKSRLALADTLGATDICDLGIMKENGETAASRLSVLTGGTGIHMAVECTAHCDLNIPEIEQSLAIGGKLVQIGHHAGVSMIFGQRFQKKGAAIYGSNGSSGHGIWEAVIRLIGNGVIDPRRIIAGRYKLEDAIDGLQAAQRGEGGKYLILPNE